MVVREKFHGDLKILREKLLEIGRLTHEALSKSIEALQTSNVELALEIIDGDSYVDDLEEEINDLAILLIAKRDRWLLI